MLERRKVRIAGIVQGVGFRPWVYRLAQQHRLAGLVRNSSGGVEVEVEGDRALLDVFLSDLQSRPPPIARIDRFSSEAMEPAGGSGFSIEPSRRDGHRHILISPDVATCDECLAELFDPRNRRFRYPFLNCTNCGPRLTIITGAPYDRAQTTMAGFEMCPACRDEFDDPADRRFHAQPSACPECGPTLTLLGPTGDIISGGDPLTQFARALVAGQVGALKGLGGFHLVCDARNEQAVRALRNRKQREEKPLAIMVSDCGAAARLCQFNKRERELLESWRRPIVLLNRLPECDELADSVAPGNPALGIMLPYTPLHHLLMREVGDIPLVMTSGNRSDVPIASRNEDALRQLGGIADLFLMHNRTIHVRCDDSVTRIVAGRELPLRRSRGFAPQPVALPFECPGEILAVGGQLKGTFAFGRDREAIVSHHLGDLDHFDAYRAFESDVALYQQVFQIDPQYLAHDLHPDYATTRFAVQRQDTTADESGETERHSRVAVQHHHAHLASCMAENGLNEPVLGVIFDGTGYGTDGTIWGGEFLLGDYRSFRRFAHLRPVGLPGGEQAIRQPWRMALAHLLDAGCDPEPLSERISPAEMRVVTTMLQRQLNTPFTSSMGRLFDAVAALLKLRDRVSYEGQAAIELEWLAATEEPDVGYPLDLHDSERRSPDSVARSSLQIDTRPLMRAITQDIRRGVRFSRIARRFHSTIVEMVAEVCCRGRQAHDVNKIAISGGVFMNALLTSEVEARLSREGFDVYRHRLVPPNDGGLSLGQLAIAAQTVQERCPEVTDATWHGRFVPTITRNSSSCSKTFSR